MNDIMRAYNLGRQLAIHKFAEETDTRVEDLTEALDSIMAGSSKATSTNVLDDSSERAGSASWGDRLELETPKNTGINV